MADSKLKRALNYAFSQNIDNMPSVQELERKYIFSENFEEKMEKLIQSVNKKYYYIFGLTFPKYILGLIFTLAVAISIAMLKYSDVIDYHQARLLFAVAELILLTVFGINTKRISYNMTRTMQTGFTDYDEIEQEDDLKFPVPVPPENYTKANEYRTSSSHDIEFTDTAGRIIYYSRIDIRTGVLTKIDSPDEMKTVRVGQWHAVWFEKDNMVNLVWADEKYRYQLKGQCDIDRLVKMAESTE